MPQPALGSLAAPAVLLALASGCAANAAARPGSEASPVELRATRVLERHRARGEFPGGRLTLREPGGGRATTTVAAGSADAAGGAPVDPEVPWGVGSITKTFVAVVVLQLAQEGRLDLDAPVSRLLPDLAGLQGVTVRQLLQHTSGLADYLHTGAVDRDARRPWLPAELVAVALARGLTAPPGAGFRYANTNYLLLGEIVERVTSRPWHVEVRRRIVEPLALRHTGYAAEPSPPRLGAGFVREDGSFAEATDRWHPSVGGAAGAMYSTTSDLLTFALALLEGNLLDGRRTAEMKAFVRGQDQGHARHDYGLGLERYTIDDLVVLGHMGTGPAHGAFMGYDPASRAAVAVQVNAASPGPAALVGAEVLAALTGKDASPPPAPTAALGLALYPYSALRRVGTGERLGELRVTSQQASASYPIVANQGATRLDLTLSYQRLQFDYRDLTHPLDSAQSFGATAFLRQRLTDAWGLILVGAPGYADDFRGPGSMDAVTLTFVGAGTYRFGERLEVGLGVAVQNVFGEPLPMPVASVDWTIAERLWLKAILPVNAELTWLPLDALGLRAALLVSGGNYHGAERTYGVVNPQLNYSAAAIDVGARWFVLPWLHLTVHGGYTLFRRFEFSQSRRPVPGGEYELARGPLVGVDLGVGR